MKSKLVIILFFVSSLIIAQQKLSMVMHGEWFTVHKCLTTEKTIYLSSSLFFSYMLGYADRPESNLQTAKYVLGGVTLLSIAIDSDIIPTWATNDSWKLGSDLLLTSVMTYCFYNVGKEGKFDKPLLKSGLLIFGLLQNYIIYSLVE